MKRYNFYRPLIIIASALLARGLVTTICLLFGMEQEAAGNVGFIAMILTALIVYTQMMKHRRPK